MRRILFAMSTMALVVSVPGSAQESPDFSGAWRMDPSRSESAHQAVPIGPVTLIIKQSADELRIETRRSEKHKAAVTSEALTFRLGSESSIVGDSGVPIKVKAHFDGTKLVTETAREIQGSAVTTMQVFTLDASGKELTVHQTLTIQHGYQFPGAANTGTGTDVFVKIRGIKK
jgi:hypothetical protein